VLKQHEAGRKVPDLAREIGVSAARIEPSSDSVAGRCDPAPGRAESIRCDNGPELTSRHFLIKLVRGTEDSTDPHSTV
jgi:hypothetical protein